MRQVQLQEEREHFASEVHDGEGFTPLRNSKSLVETKSASSPYTEEEHRAAAERLTTLMRKGFDLGGVWNGRDTLYDAE